MITVADGAAVERLLRRVAARPADFRQVAVCAPFIDEPSVRLLTALAGHRAGVPQTAVVTTPATAIALAGSWRLGERTVRLATHDRLHAKVYIVEGHRPSDSEVIVTSANFTRPGLRKNVELGISALPTTRCGAAVFTSACHWLRRLTVDATRKEVSR